MHDQNVTIREPLTAAIQRRGSFAGTGCLVQGAGLVLGIALFALIPVAGWIIAPLAGISLLAVGSRMAFSYECNNCHNPIASTRVRLCPSCHANLTWRGR